MQDKKDQGAVALVLDMTKAFERVSVPVVWAWATHFSFPKEDLACAVRLFRAPRGRYSWKDVWRSCARPSRPFSLDPSGVAYS